MNKLHYVFSGLFNVKIKVKNAIGGGGLGGGAVISYAFSKNFAGLVQDIFNFLFFSSTFPGPKVIFPLCRFSRVNGNPDLILLFD